MFMGTIDSYYFIPLSVNLALTGVTKSVRSKTSWPDFQLIRVKYHVVLGQFKLKHPDPAFE